MASGDDDPRLPMTVRPYATTVLALTEVFCVQHLDGEYAQLCRKVVTRLARKRPSPLLRGDLRIWAASIIYAVGSINALFDASQQPHLSGEDLSALTGVPKSTLANKAKAIRDTLRLDLGSFEFQRRDFIERNPAAWVIRVDGFPVDARLMPREIQDEARRRGLIPDLPPRGNGDPA